MPSELKCSKCSKPAEPGAPKCASCGARVVRVCGGCGGQNSPAKIFCDSCGKPLGADAGPARPSAAHGPVQELSVERFEKVQSPAPEHRGVPEAEPPKPAPEVKAPAPVELPKIELPAEAPKEAPKAEPPAPAEKNAEPRTPGGVSGALPRVDGMSLRGSAEDAEAERKARDEERRRRIAEFEMPKTGIMRISDLHKAEPPKEPPKAEPPKEEPPRPKSLREALTKPPAPEKPREEPKAPERPKENAKPPEKPKTEPPHARHTPSPKGRTPSPFGKNRTPAPRPIDKKHTPAPEKPKETPKAPPPEPKVYKDPADRFRRPEEREREHAAPKSPPPAPAKAAAKPAPKPAPQPASRPAPAHSKTSVTAKPSPFSTVAGLVLLVAGLLVYGGYWWRFKHNPANRLSRVATRFVTTLVAGNPDAAYELLSPKSRAEITLDEFKRSVPPAGGALGPAQIEVMEEDWALVRYDSAMPGAVASTERISFVREDGNWVRAFEWPLLLRADAMLAAGDAIGAGTLASKAAAIDPRDPLPKAYLCESAYARSAMPEAYEACRAAVDLAKRYPSALDERDLFRLHELTADLLRNFLGKPAEAVREYGILLALPRLEPAERCGILLARADVRAEQNEAKAALADYQEAAGACPAGDEAAYAKGAVALFSGAAGDDAVAMVQRSRTSDDESTILEWRAKTAADIKRHFGSKSTLKAVADAWTSEWLGGSLYRVSLRSAQMQILDAKVDLWNQTLKVELHVQ
ncbi:MAG: hypothetical protein WC969_11100 [Elusimicrobiota bacterium]|jgi:tetratricopeptide (TPR) repeat protein